MEISIRKVVSKGNEAGVYMGVAVKAASKEYELIRLCRQRWWSGDLKLWLIPNTSVAWQEFKQLFTGYQIVVAEEDLQMEGLHKVKHEKQNKSSLEKQPLNQDQSLALLKMREQLIIQQYQGTTIKSYTGVFTEFLLYYSDKTVDDITEEEIRQYLLHKIQNGHISESTQNCIINGIKFYYERVLGRERFFITDIRPRRPKKLPHFLTEDETVKLFSVVSNRKHRLILMLIYSSGLRLGELIRLRVKDINIQDGIIYIYSSKGKKDRISTLAEKLKKGLQDYLREYKPRHWLFEGQSGGQYSERSVQNILRKAVDEAEVNPYATVHTLRHSYATHLLQGGVDIRQIQELLGHESIKTTEIYTHITDILKRRVKSPIDGLEI